MTPARFPVLAIAFAFAVFIAPGPRAQQAAPAVQPVISDYARILPVIGRQGMVVSQEASASRIGLDVLKRGGNAVDAAVAVGFALAVTLPRAGNLGGGGFMLLHRADMHQSIAIDYRETAPAATTKDVFLDEKGNADPRKSMFSGLAIGVPGTVAGLELAQRKYGSGKFSLAELVAPAVRLAREGLAVDDDLADSLPAAAKMLARYPSSARIFLKGDGSALARGDMLVQTDLANTLEAIGRDGPQAFYEGAIAEKIAAAVREAGGRMQAEDLKAYQPFERAPVAGVYRGYDIVSMPPPSSGGVHVVQILNLLEGFPIGALGANSAETIHLMAEAMKLAYADRSEFLGDPAFVEVPVRGLTSKAYAGTLRPRISATRARPAAEIKSGAPLPYESDQTTHFSVVDKDGNAVSNTCTLNFSYGLGMVAEGTGVLLNNELDDFAAKPGVPNAYGLIGGLANAPGPGKRPLSSMSPTLVFKDGQLVLVTGSPGGSRIITTVLQIIMNVIDHGMNAAEATEAVRVHHQWLPDELRVERGLSIDTIRLLEAKGHKVVTLPTMGSTQTIQRAEGLLYGAADTRQRGTGAVGY